MFGLWSKQWQADDIPDQTGRVIIVTGANTGIGYETAKAVLVKNAKVYVACRSPERAKAAIEKLKSETGKEALFLQLDLSDLHALRKSAEDFQSKESHLDVLFNNAGIMATPPSELTKDGYERQFGINTLGHFHFTTLLLPQLLAANPPGRVVNTTSDGHQIAPSEGIDFNTLRGIQGSTSQGIRAKVRAYGQSKLGNILFANELHHRYGAQGLVATSVHPGAVATELGRDFHPVLTTLAGLFMGTPANGALTQLYAATAPETKELGGKYFVPLAKLGTPLLGNDKDLAGKMWNWCEEELKKF